MHTHTHSACARASQHGIPSSPPVRPGSRQTTQTPPSGLVRDGSEPVGHASELTCATSSPRVCSFSMSRALSSRFSFLLRSDSSKCSPKSAGQQSLAARASASAASHRHSCSQHSALLPKSFTCSSTAGLVLSLDRHSVSRASVYMAAASENLFALKRPLPESRIPCSSCSPASALLFNRSLRPNMISRPSFPKASASHLFLYTSRISGPPSKLGRRSGA
mmetsp:Transcript_9971/g.24616  ORF Transcript_9971/g.24616 Transcript_9971/m.24616 type:complete len:220 (+) Transcript_9971:148-807(+)